MENGDSLWQERQRRRQRGFANKNDFWPTFDNRLTWMTWIARPVSVHQNPKTASLNNKMDRSPSTASVNRTITMRIESRLWLFLYTVIKADAEQLCLFSSKNSRTSLGGPICFWNQLPDGCTCCKLLNCWNVHFSIYWTLQSITY